jgi:hypothetical protein
MTTSTGASPAARVERADWPAATADLDAVGMASIGELLSPSECGEITATYDDLGRFRSTVDMERYRFGAGQYRYFARPLPDPIETLRHALWPRLLPVAREWAARLRTVSPWPDDLDDWLARCHAAGQTRPTPLLLRYGVGDWNALHRDLYGDLVFPLQVVIGLDRPGIDYRGGEFVMVEQRPRAQSRATAMVVGQGEGVVFTTRHRPIASARGWSAAPMRHGVSTVRGGHRHALGIPFHDAT